MYWDYKEVPEDTAGLLSVITGLICARQCTPTRLCGDESATWFPEGLLGFQLANVKTGAGNKPGIGSMNQGSPEFTLTLNTLELNLQPAQLD